MEELLKEILKSKEFVSGVIAAIAALVAAIIAALATVIGPFVTTRISRKQTTATLRQQWIDSLRDNIAELSSIINYLLIDNEIPLATDDDKKIYLRLYNLESKIQLLLNPKENDHIELIEIIGKLLIETHNTAEDGTSRINRVSDIHNLFIEKSQVILKKEWERVKKE